MTGIVASIDSQPIMIDQQPGYSWPGAGTFIDGVVLGTYMGGTTVDLEGQKVTVPSDVNIIENVGESATFEVVRSGNNPELRYIRPDSDVRSFSVASQKMPATVTKDYSDIIEASISHLSEDEQDQIQVMVKEAQDAIRSLAGGLSDGDLKQMIRDGFNPEKEGIEMVAHVLKENRPLVKSHQMAQVSGAVSTEVAKLRSQYQDQDQLEGIARSLKNAGTAVNRKNVDRIQSALGTLDSVSSMSSEKAAEVLKQLDQQSLPPTLAEVYKLSQSPVGMGASLAISEDELDFMVTGYLENAGMSQDTETVEAAKMLISRQVPVSQETIAFVISPGQVLTARGQEAYVSDMAGEIAEGNSPTSVLVPELAEILSQEEGTVSPETIADSGAETLSPERIETLDTLLKQARTMKDTDMVKAILAGKTKTLAEAVSVINDSGSEDITVSQSPTADLTQEAIAFKRQLSEIQLKMTLEAALRMEEQGISVDTSALEEVVSRLESEELMSAAVSVRAYTTEDLPERNLEMIDQVSNTMGASKAMTGLHEDTLANMIRDEIPLTMTDITGISAGLEDASISSELNRQKALDGYDSSMTEIRRDLGDRIENTFGQIGPILEDLSMTESQANIRAVEILARNGMAIDESSILEIQILQEKVDQVTAKLMPATVVAMVGAGIDPTSMELDELLLTADAFGNSDDTGKISELIYELDSKGTLSSEERQTMMAIYRTMDTVTRSKGAATGFMVKNDLSLTLNGLFEASKYISKTRQIQPAITANIDDSFGMLEDVTNADRLLHEQTSEGTSGNADSLIQLRQDLMSLRISAFVQSLNGDSNNTLVQENSFEGIGKLPLEEVTDLIRSQTGNGAGVDAERYLDTISGKPELLKAMITRGLPMTFENFSKAVAMDRDTFLLMDEVGRMVDGIESPELKDSAISRLTQASEEILKGEASYDSLRTAIEEVEEMIRHGEETPSASSYKAAESARATVSQVEMLQVSEDYYQIPVYMEQELTQLNMYILNQEKVTTDDSSEMKVLMSFEAGGMGRVQALISLEGNNAAMQIQSTYPEDRPLLQDYEEAFRQVIDTSNFTLTGVSYESFREKEPVEIPEAESVAVRTAPGENGHIDWSV